MSKRKKSKSAHNTLASRLRYARESRNIEPQALRAELKRKKIVVSKQLLHRYETVETQNPNLNIVEGIADITGFSAGWLLFGKGPMFASDPINQITRQLRLQSLFRGPRKTWPAVSRLKAAGVSIDELEFHRKYPFVRSVSDELARSLETASEQAIGWMDTAPEGVGRHSHHQRLSDTLELMAASLALNDQQRAAFITLLKTLPTDT
jgi:transcriptional regulator with XRE-family HTH domain